MNDPPLGIITYEEPIPEASVIHAGIAFESASFKMTVHVRAAVPSNDLVQPLCPHPEFSPKYRLFVCTSRTSCAHFRKNELLGRSIVSEGNQTKEEVQVDHQRRGDALLQGFWKGGTTCIVDNQFVYLDAPSYLDREPKAVLATREAAKKKKHRGDCALNRRHFTPFIASRDAILAKEANSFTRAMAAHLANKWRRAYSDICGYIKGRMGLTIIRASTRCLYGSRVPVRYISSAPEWSDGLGLGLWTTLSDSSISGTPPSAVRRAES